nr:hypothetical protein [uncultured Actinoplanes sp.]
MRTSARRELAFVLAVAAAGLAIVLVVVFAPWYSPSDGPATPIPRLDKQQTRLVGNELEASSTTP